MAGAALVLAAAGTALVLRPDAEAPDPRPSPTALPTGTAAPCPSPTGVKPVLTGLVSITRLPPAPLDRAVGGLSVNVAWADLQPDADGDLVRPNAVDEAVSTVAALNAADGGCRGVKLRVLAGVGSPGWALGLDGPPVRLVLPQDDLEAEVPRFWGPRYAAAYAGLQQRLSAAYDAVPEVREVVLSRCTTFYAEPLVRQVRTGTPSDGALHAAGLDEAADRACLREQVDAHRVWRRTPSSLALNPYVSPEPGSGGPSLDVALATADHCRAQLGERCVLANNSVRSPPLGGQYAALYQAMRDRGPALEFQAAAPSRIGDTLATVRWAAEQGASSIEVEPVLLRQAGAPVAALAESAWPPSGD